MKKEEFEQNVKFILLGEDENEIDKFIEYWTETSLNGKKMRFEAEKFFSIKRRFTTWKSNSKKWVKPASDTPLLDFINTTYGNK